MNNDNCASCDNLKNCKRIDEFTAEIMKLGKTHVEAYLQAKYDACRDCPNFKEYDWENGEI